MKANQLLIHREKEREREGERLKFSKVSSHKPKTLQGCLFEESVLQPFAISFN
jgi:hypothetical protein